MIQIFSQPDLEKTKHTVWQVSVLPFIFNKNTNFSQKTLLWIAEHTLAGMAIGMISVSAIGVLAWGTTKDVTHYSSITEAAFKKSNIKTTQTTKSISEKSFSKGNFQPIIVEQDNTLQPLDKITSGNAKN